MQSYILGIDACKTSSGIRVYEWQETDPISDEGRGQNCSESVHSYFCSTGVSFIDIRFT